MLWINRALDIELYATRIGETTALRDALIGEAMGKPKFSFQKHQNTGSKLKKIRQELLTLSVEIGNSYPNASKVCRRANKAVEAIDELRSELDSQLFKDCPTETSGDDWKGVYYGTTHLTVVRNRGT